MKKEEGVGIVVFAFGAPATIHSNRILAKIASDKAHKLSIPIYTQADIILENDIDVERIQEKHGNPPPTLKISKRAIRWAEKRHIRKLFVVAATPHLWRCLRDLNAVKEETKYDVSIYVYDEIYRLPDYIWFCPNSRQIWTRSRIIWKLRENILRLMPLWLYKYISR